jgi:hypothetical protein
VTDHHGRAWQSLFVIVRNHARSSGRLLNLIFYQKSNQAMPPYKERLIVLLCLIGVTTAAWLWIW